MVLKSKHKRKYIILPACLLLFNIIQEVITYKLKSMDNKYLMVGVIMVLLIAGFSVIIGVMAPWVEKWMERLYKTSRKQGGNLGELLVIAGIAGGLFFVYYVTYATNAGIANLLPPFLRN